MSIFYNILLGLISLVHFIILISMVTIPFTNYTYLLFCYIIFVPFIVFHWVIKNNICFLTLLEKIIRIKLGNANIKNVDCFTCRLIEPVYDFVDDNKKFTHIIYTIVIGLWLLCIFKIYKKIKNNEINNFIDIFKKT